MYRIGLAIAAAGCLAATTLSALPASAVYSTVGSRASLHAMAAGCNHSVAAGYAHCAADVLATPNNQAAAAATPSGYGPADLQSAYAIATAAASNGAGQTVAIIDAFDDSTAAADLAIYRSTYGLPACTTANGCFKKVNQNGQQGSYPSNNQGWALEVSLDLDVVSAVCPKCHILLVEANSNSNTNLFVAENRAATLHATEISNSWGGGESSSERSYDSYFNHAGIAITASSGDGGYGVEYPAASRYVNAVGGTSLQRSSTTRGWTETAWGGTGSGCSAYETKPTWQHDTGCSRRTVVDVAAVADPYTGVAVYDSNCSTVNQANGTCFKGWGIVGGTSVGAPLIAALYALAGNAASVTYGSYPYSHTSSLNDVKSGSNGSCSPSYLCHATTGYDGPTGKGTPKGTAAF